jgi:hypothetical protein
MLRTKRAVALWQFIFLLLASSWLWGPQLNHLLSDRTALISQYESPGQPYAWLFRLNDMLAAALLIMAAGWLAGSRRRNISTWLLLIIGLGMLVDPVFASNCRLDELSCRQHLTPAFIIHATETAITASALFIIAVYDSWRRKTLVSISFVVFRQPMPYYCSARPPRKTISIQFLNTFTSWSQLSGWLGICVKV